jgi:predicted metal-dependent peptidase
MALRRRRNKDYSLDEREKQIWDASIGGAALASTMLRSTMMLLKPYKSKIVDVAGVDKDWRAALGDRFFTYTQAEREAIIVHICLHAVCNYSSRSTRAGQSDTSISRLAQDLEINQMVITLSRVRLPNGSPIPKISGAEANGLDVYDVPPGKSMEQYYQMLAPHGQGQSADPSAGQSAASNPASDSDASSSNNDQQSSKDTNEKTDDDKKSSQMSPSSSKDSSDEQDTASDENQQSSTSSDANDQHDPNNDQQSSSTKDHRDKGEDDDANQRSSSSSPTENEDGSLSWDQSQDDESQQSSEAHDEQQRNTDICANASEADIQAEADDAGIPKSRNDQKVSATSKMIEEANRIASISGRMPGLGVMDKKFAIDLSKAAEPPVMDWRRNLMAITQDLVSKQAYRKTEYSFKRVNRRGSAFMRDGVFPSVIGYQPKVMMAIDTSYSVSHDDRQVATIARNAEEVLKAVTRGVKNTFKVFCVDTQIKPTDIVNNVDDLNIQGGGGTDMGPAFEYVSSLNRMERPDVFILATDGGLSDKSWKRCADAWPKGVKVIVMITDAYYLDRLPLWLHEDAQIIDVSG